MSTSLYKSMWEEVVVLVDNLLKPRFKKVKITKEGMRLIWDYHKVKGTHYPSWMKTKIPKYPPPSPGSGTTLV